MYIRLQHQPSGHSTFVSIAETVVSACERFMTAFFSFFVAGVPWKCSYGACGVQAWSVNTDKLLGFTVLKTVFPKSASLAENMT